MKNKNKICRKPGSTLMEILIYFGILSIVLLIAMSFAIQILSVNKLSGNSFELQTNLNFITSRVIQKIHTADSVDLAGSVLDNDTGTLSLNFSDPGKSPTKLYLESGRIKLKEGTNEAVELNSDLIKIDKLRFHRVSGAKSPDQIIFDIEATPTNTEIANIDRIFKIHLSVNLRYL